MSCRFKTIKYISCEKTISVEKIVIDEAAVENSNHELGKLWLAQSEWEKTATPEQIKEAEDVWNSFGGGH